MNDFTASNGIRIRVAASSWAYAATGSDYFDEIAGFAAGSPLEEALRQFFRAETDERLGRWRWPENPDYVVYLVGDDVVDVLREASLNGGARGPGRQKSITREDAAGWDSDNARNFYVAARAYFDAHPETRPWDEAKPGDVWRFETSDDRRHALGWVAQDGTWDLMTPRGENVREVVEPVAWLVENWGDEFEGAKATRFVPEVSS